MSWHCLHCHRPTELNMDREMNVCSHCGSPRVKLVPDQDKRLSKERLHELTEGMRTAIDSESTNSEQNTST